MPVGGSKLGAHGRERVLVVEPDRDAGGALSELLRQLGYAVEVARSGPEALSALSRVPPVLVLVAQHLSGAMDPDALLAAVRRMRDLKTVPVVATGQPGEGVDAGLRKHDVTAFLGTPATLRALESAIRVANGKEPLDLPASALRPDRGASRPRRVRPRPTSFPQGAPSSASMVAVAGHHEVDCDLEWESRRASCVLERATDRHVIVRCHEGSPPAHAAVRLTVPFRTVVSDAMQDVPVRVLGRLIAKKSLAGGARLKVEVKVAQPEANYRLLQRFLRPDAP